MKIAQVAPLYESVPPKFYGGTERIVAYLTSALVELGHDVTLFASGDTVTKAKLVPCRDQAIRLDDGLKADIAAHLTMVESVRAQADAFDIIHFHTDLLHMPIFDGMAEGTLTTLHGRLDLKDLPAYYRRFSEFPLVSISNHQRLPLPDANWAATVYHGLPIDRHVLTAFPQGDYLAFLGRISREKRPDRAIEIAKRAGMKLKIAAKVDDVDRSYFKQEIEPLFNHPLIDFVGEITDAQKAEFLGNARALLFPIDWPEPFGLVSIEAMACGTPVIAYRCGSVPEVVDHGVTGLIVDDIETAVDAVREVRDLNRLRIRRQFEQRFSAAVMARNYLQVYEQLLPHRMALAANASEPRSYGLRHQ